MKTKYLLSAALLAGVFAACTNEDLVAPSIGVNGQQDGRPTVNVKLEVGFADEANTRLAFDQNKGYQFLEGDRIGALLMDKIDGADRPFENAEAWAKLSWLEKYTLTDYMHTDYPFECTEKTTEGGTKWESNAKMLEGNYFFAFPYDGYGAKRQLSHSIIDQKQDGGTLASAMKSYADNQFFVGYAQIKEGNATKDALTNVSMTSVLGAVRFQLKNIGTRDQKITKIVLSGTDISSVLTFDPTDADYKGEDATKTTGTSYNLRGDNGGAFTAQTEIFNYANYLGLEADDLYKNTQYAAATDFVYNIPTTEKDNYNKGNALRAVVKTYSTNNVYDKYAELALTENGNEGIVAKANGANIIETCIMINPIAVANSTDLLLSIYTTEGLIKNIDLSKENEEQKGSGGLAANTVITNQAVKNVGPEVRNVVEVQFDNNSVQAPVKTLINNSDDLKQYVGWIAKLGNKRLNTIELTNSAAIDAETAALLKKENVILYVTKTAGNNAKLQLEKEVGVENVLDNIIVKEDVTIEILGTANIGKSTLNHDYQSLLKDVQQTALTTWKQDLKLEVAKGATLNVIGTQLNDDVIAIEVVDNKGTINITKDSNISNIKVVNNATMQVDGTITMATGSVNELNAVITVSETGVLSGTTSHNFSNKGTLNNFGKIWNVINASNSSVKPSTVNIYKEATVSNFNDNKGVIVYDELATANAITFDQAITDAIRGIVKYTTKYADDVTEVNKVITTETVNKFNITDLTVTQGKFISTTGRPDKPVAAGKVAYDLTKSTLNSLIVKGDVTISGKEYPLLMRGEALIQIDGDVQLGTSIIAATLNSESYITGTVTVTEKVAIASAGEAVFAGSPIAFDHSEFTAIDFGTILKGAKISINAGDFFAVAGIAGVDKTSNSVNAEGTFYCTTVGTNVTTSGNVSNTLPSPLSDK